jgi:type III secretory pathway component EscT
VATPIWKSVRNSITAITNANPGVVTTASDHGYFTGLIVRFEFFADFGMQNLLGNLYNIIVLSPTTFSINADTTTYDPFFISSTVQVPQVTAVGEIANTLKNSVQNLLTPIGGP